VEGEGGGGGGGGGGWWGGNVVSFETTLSLRSLHSFAPPPFTHSFRSNLVISCPEASGSGAAEGISVLFIGESSVGDINMQTFLFTEDIRYKFCSSQKINQGFCFLSSFTV